MAVQINRNHIIVAYDNSCKTAISRFLDNFEENRLRHKIVEKELQNLGGWEIYPSARNTHVA